MNLWWIIIYVIYYRQNEVTAYLYGSLGCYMFTHTMDIDSYARYQNNSGYVCKRYCFTEILTKYAGTMGTHGKGCPVNYNVFQEQSCFCISKIQNEMKVADADCSVMCPIQQDEICGGKDKLTLYDSESSTTTTIASTTSSSNSPDLLLSFRYIIKVITALFVVIILVVAALLLRHCRIRKRRNILKCSKNLSSVSHVDLCENRRVVSRHDGIDTEYDTTTTSRPKLPNDVKDDNSLPRIPKGSFEDPI